jgi:hypothetical protein
MKRFIKICAVILLVFSSNGVVFAQNTQPTPYQKKTLELSKKWFQKLAGYQMTMSDEAFYEKLAKGEEAYFVLSMVVMNYAMTHSESQTKQVITQMDNEFKQAEKLKNATDFRLEKEAKERVTIAGAMKNEIKSKFQKWNQKGEFEKQSDFEDRLQTQSQNKFVEICMEVFARTNNLKDEHLKRELLSYDPENEVFCLTLKKVDSPKS